MEIQALKGLVPVWYTPPKVDSDGNESGDSYDAEFLLRPLTAPQVAELQPYFDRATGEITAKGLWRAAQLSVSNWRGVVDEEGNDVPYKLQMLELVPYSAIVKIGSRVLQISFLTGDEEKNL